MHGDGGRGADDDEGSGHDDGIHRTAPSDAIAELARCAAELRVAVGEIVGLVEEHSRSSTPSAELLFHAGVLLQNAQAAVRLWLETLELVIANGPERSLAAQRAATGEDDAVRAAELADVEDQLLAVGLSINELLVRLRAGGVDGAAAG